MRLLASIGVAAALFVGVPQFCYAADINKPAKIALAKEQPEMKFDNVSLGDCLDFIRDVSSINMHVDWKALGTVNITKDTMINLRLRGVTLHKAMDLVLSEAGEGHLLTYYIDQNVIEVTTKAVADHQLFTKVYPVEDLITDIPDFTNAPQFNLSSSSGQGGQGGATGSSGSSGSSSQGLFGGSGGGSGSGSNSSTPTVSKTQRADELVKLIEDTIQPEIWKDAGGFASIRYYNGSLIVTAPRSVHEAIGGPID